MSIKIAPSILAGTFENLGAVVEKIEQTNAEVIHIDVMDGQFVPPITFGSQMVQSLRAYSKKRFDVHLMVQNPEQQIPLFIHAGADMISFHVEASRHPHRLLQQIKQSGVKAGIVLNPGTSAFSVAPLLNEVDYVLQMSVNPGFGGQAFIPEVLKNVEQLAKWRKEEHLTFEIEIDGGVNEETAFLCKQAGVDILVAGSAVLGTNDWQKAIDKLRG
ncbi:ribulose-5-phosphate 3-epimerase [Pilibacter termitis]|uniref:Ribulose-phosphate 3-epimerase n=1 Tax=Pilibacter termitis TaxID=263852 RepID=A0A1T4LYV3_9ENTE|nr:ribulose-phosphate 3-epimerase [Pilibacter termitis]SJZ59919.1 ribulose-5-phosphate 3-epimerase [Pilibacter termitis]